MTMSVIETARKMMGWCPVADTKINEPPSEEGYANKSDSNKPDSGASGKFFGSLFEWDYIVKEELLRSIAVLFFTIVTFAIFVIMVWYRKNTLSPIIYRYKNIKPLRELSILIVVYAAYLYFSLQYPVLHKAWFLILLFTAIKLGKICYCYRNRY